MCTRGPQSLSSLRARRDHDPALITVLGKLTVQMYQQQLLF